MRRNAFQANRKEEVLHCRQSGPPLPLRQASREHSECTPKRRRVFGVHSLFSACLPEGERGPLCLSEELLPSYQPEMHFFAYQWYRKKLLVYFFHSYHTGINISFLHTMKKCICFLPSVKKLIFFIPVICEEMHFRLIGRNKFFTAGRVAPSSPQASLHC